jgi:putative addiction module component (TIGR02574 family)
MRSFSKKDIQDLSVSERISLVEDIWDSIAQVTESVSLSDEEKAKIDQRLDAYHQDPNAGSPWSKVRERIKSRA